MRLGMSSRRA